MIELRHVFRSLLCHHLTPRKGLLLVFCLSNDDDRPDGHRVEHKQAGK